MGKRGGFVEKNRKVGRGSEVRVARKLTWGVEGEMGLVGVKDGKKVERGETEGEGWGSRGVREGEQNACWEVRDVEEIEREVRGELWLEG